MIENVHPPKAFQFTAKFGEKEKGLSKIKNLYPKADRE